MMVPWYRLYTNLSVMWKREEPTPTLLQIYTRIITRKGERHWFSVNSILI